MTRQTSVAKVTWWCGLKVSGTGETMRNPFVAIYDAGMHQLTCQNFLGDKVDLSLMDFTDAYFVRCSFERANLRGTQFRDSILTGSTCLLATGALTNVAQVFAEARFVDRKIVKERQQDRGDNAMRQVVGVAGHNVLSCGRLGSRTYIMPPCLMKTSVQ